MCSVIGCLLFVLLTQFVFYGVERFLPEERPRRGGAAEEEGPYDEYLGLAGRVLLYRDGHGLHYGEHWLRLLLLDAGGLELGGHLGIDLVGEVHLLAQPLPLGLGGLQDDVLVGVGVLGVGLLGGVVLRLPLGADGGEVLRVLPGLGGPVVRHVLLQVVYHGVEDGGGDERVLHDEGELRLARLLGVHRHHYVLGEILYHLPLLLGKVLHHQWTAGPFLFLGEKRHCQADGFPRGREHAGPPWAFLALKHVVEKSRGKLAVRRADFKVEKLKDKRHGVDHVREHLHAYGVHAAVEVHAHHARQ